MERAGLNPSVLDPERLLKKAGLTVGMNVGDFGTGGAAYFGLQAARMIGEKARLFAVDVFKPALSAAMGKARLAGLRNIVPVWSNLEVFNATAAVADQSLDFGMLINVLHQAERPEAVLHECTRMMKVGGKLLVVEWRQSFPGFGPKRDKIMSRDTVEKLAGRFGLVQRHTFEPGDYHWAMVFERVR